MSVKTFQNNRDKISENIVKLKLEQNVKFLLYNDLVYIYVEETDCDNFMIILPDKTDIPL